ncbi:MAG: tetrahydromethanopterin S-methyltransferase subunit H [Candidatus Aenigmarchaeota archaeon]|nr:tetrahydromethanopterin S-methyltransferase subunit H [Candidatus Aenigmarchaeota archaeon]
MFIFPNPKELDIAGVKIGGQTGKNPPVLVGTMFYNGHKILNDSGFDANKAENLLNTHMQASHDSGLPSMMNVFGAGEDALVKQVEFVLERTNIPVLLDSQDAKTRLGALKRLEEAGATKRLVYNSLNMTINQKEIEGLRASKIENAIILAYSATDTSLEGKIHLLEKECAFGKGLLEIAGDCGIKNILIDTAMTPVASGAGIALRALPGLKAKFGLPTGCAMHNAVSAWDYVRTRKTRKSVDLASNLLPPALGADFLFYGPIENAGSAFDIARLGYELAKEC